MTLTKDERDAIVSYRIAKAKETLRQIENLLPLGYWSVIGNRLYYSIYYIVSALLVSKSYTANTHSGVKNLLSLHFVKTGLLSKDYMKLYSKIFDFRLKGDYDDFFDLEEEDILPLIEPVKDFLAEIERLIKH
jgi:uncharacterized protein (UPF0332 family)